jgi:exonuclease III
MNIVSVVSYNIWFDPTNLRERTMSLVDIIEDNKPDVLCFQEVLEPVNQVLKEVFKKLGYINSYPDRVEDRYDCVIFSKYPIVDMSRIPYDNSSMNRGITSVVIEYPIFFNDNDEDKLISIENNKIIIATSHFESVFKDQINATKIEQYNIAKEYLDIMAKSYKHVIFCCDSNILKSEEKTFLTNDPHWKDAWIETGKDSNKEYTYDTETNKNLTKRNLGSSYQERIDRIIYRGDLIARSFDLITEGNCILPPSDHHGIMAKFEILN